MTGYSSGEPIHQFQVPSDHHSFTYSVYHSGRAIAGLTGRLILIEDRKSVDVAWLFAQQCTPATQVVMRRKGRVIHYRG